MGLRKTKAHIRQGIYLKNAQDKIEQIDAQLATIVDMQRQLAIAISDLTEYSAMHQITSKVVDAYIFFRTFLDLKKGYKVIANRPPATVVTETGMRATVLKNYPDFASAIARRETYRQGANESIKSLRNNIALSIRNHLSELKVNNLSQTSELALYFDAFNSGKGVVNALYKMNEELDRQYDQLILKKNALKYNE